MVDSNLYIVKGDTSALPFGFVNGIRSSVVYKSGEWTAWRKTPVDIIVDMEQTEPYSSVAVGMLCDNAAHIFFPTRIVVSVSDDGEEFTVVAEEEYEVGPKEPNAVLKDFQFVFPQTSARFVKVHMEPVMSIPQGHNGAGTPAYMFVDEIMVR